VLNYFAPSVAGEGLRRRQASEQYLTDSQFLAQDFRQVISLPQLTQSLLGKKDLLPLNPDFSGLPIPTH
jgi:hypothetical protein